MNTRNTPLIGILAVLGLLFKMLVPGGDLSAGPKLPEPQKKLEAKPGSVWGTSPPKVPHEGPWFATCHFAGEPTQSVAMATQSSFCLDGAGYSLNYLIATIPDPVHTRLGHFADRSVESIQRAARRAGWDSDAVWLPWQEKAGEDGKGKLGESPGSDAEPGLLLFRARAQPGHTTFETKLLLVFLVGETPTAGIDRVAFRKAESYGDSLAPGKVRYIAGPTFSGSLPSLARFTDESKAWFRIVSGTVTNADYVETFQGGKNNKQTRVQFQTMAFTSAVTRDRVCEVAARLGISHSEVAVLVEGETSFGRILPSRGTNPCPGRTITFPREISSLRNVYSASAVASGKGPVNPVPLTLRDTEGGEDSTPVFDRAHTPQSQYAVLNSIVTSLRGNTRLVAIAATNVLDAVFLANVIHEGSPDTRIALEDADLLFVRAASEDKLSGLLAFSQYPLVTWTQTQQMPVIPFPDSSAQGIYNAVAELLNEQDFSPEKTKPIDGGALAPWVLEATPWGYWPLLPGTNHPPDKLPGAPRVWLILDFITGGSFLALLTFVLRAYSQQTRLWEAFESKRGLLAMFVSTLALVAATNFPLLFQNSAHADIKIWAWRATQLTSGASGLVPIVFLLLAMILWSAVYLWRVSLAKHRNPGLPMPAPGSAHDAMGVYESKAGRATGCAGQYEWRKLLLGLGLILSLAYVLKPGFHLSTLNPEPYTTLLWGLAGVALASVGFSTWRCYQIWIALRGVLTELDGLPLDGAFRRIPRESSAAIWLQLPCRRNYRPLFRSADCLAELRAEMNRHGKTSTDLPEQIDDVNSLRQKVANGEADHQEYKKATETCVTVANHLLVRDLKEKWDQGLRDPDPGKEKPDKPAADKSTASETCAAPQVDKLYLLAAEFVALRYAAWIRYVIMQMRNLVWHASIAFALTALALNSLNFQSPQAIRYFLTFSLILFGAPILSIMMQVERNPVLSRMADTTVGELSFDFYLKGLSYGLLPIIGVLSSDFPGFSRFLTSWLQPTLESLK
ncbi:MAG TPA: hypothetical protein VNH18_26075 [Bryobacteraceae bacterium]|nr:hypothetical protein [Bryobacteraceae bacterium]